eukprot:1275356-Amphidinium_carterae.1
MTEEATKQYVTVTGEGLNMSDCTETTIVIGNIIMQVRFIVANVPSPLIGLPDMDYNELAVHTGNEPHIEQYGCSERAVKIGSHLYLAAKVLPGLHNHEEAKVAGSIRTRYSATSQSQLIIGEVEDLSNQAYVPRQLRQHPHLPTTIESTGTPIHSHALPQLVSNLREGQGTAQSPQEGGAQGTITDTTGLRLHQVNNRQPSQYGPNRG